jgi:hypothetical protein
MSQGLVHSLSGPIRKPASCPKPRFVHRHHGRWVRIASAITHIQAYITGMRKQSRQTNSASV